MPTLPQYTAKLDSLPISGGRRAELSDFGGEGGIEAGRAIQRAAGAYLSQVEDKESRTALVSSSEIRAKYAKRLDEAALNGEDLDRLREQMGDELSKVGENFQTKRGQESLALYTSNTNLMFDEQSNRIAVQRAAATARIEGSKFINSASAIIQSNPLYLEVAEKDAEEFGKTLKGIRPEQRVEIVQGLKRELNMAAAIGYARVDPETAKKKLDAGEWDLTSEQRNIALNKVDTEIRARRADETYRRALAEADERDRDEKARDTLFKGIIDGTTTRRAIMDSADLKPTTREHLIVFMEHRAKALVSEEKRSDPGTMRDLWMRIHAPEGDPRRILNGDSIFEAVKAGKLNTADANQLNTLVANQKDENGRKIRSSLYAMSSAFQRALEVDPRMSKQKMLGEIPAIVNEYTAMVQELVSERRAANDAAGLRELFNPKSKTYVGSAEFMQQSIDRVEARQRDARPQLIDLTRTPDEALNIPVGAAFVDPKGVTRTMTQQLLDQLKKDGAKPARTFPVVLGGETPTAREQRAAADLGKKYQAWQESGAVERVDFMEWLMTGGKGL